MRYALVEVTPREGGIHPVDGQLAEDDDIQRVALHHIHRLSDGSGVLLYYLRGDADRIRELISEHPDTLAGEVSEMGDSIYAYIHFKPEAGSIADELLRLTQELEIVLDPPFECTEGGGFRVTLVGEDAAIQRAAQQTPAGLSAELLELGEYRPERERLASMLTDRQREILRTAIDAGYYEEPRRVTYEDLADELDLSSATVGEHLRRIEGKILTEVDP